MSAPDALTRYYYAKEREESAVLYINDAYLEAVDALEKLEAENAKLFALLKHESEQTEKLRELVKDIHTLATDYGVYVQYPYCDAWDEKLAVAEKQMRELGIEVNG